MADIRKSGELTLLALMPCGLKVPFGKALSAFLEDLKVREGLSITYAVEGNLNQELSYYPYVETIEALEELPDIIVSADFNVFYQHHFYRRFVEPGHLVGYGQVAPCPAFAEAGLNDSRGEYFLFGVNPLVLVVDLDRIGDRPLPGLWADILDPVWKNDVILRGNDDFYCHAVLLPLFQEGGEEALLRLAGNVRAGMHPAQMVKQIDSGQGGALYVMPEFFAHRVKRKERIAIIWPRDGALASPVTLQVKRNRVAELKPVLDWLTGSELARTLVGARFPVPNAEVEGDLQQLPLKWLGWDWLRNNDLRRVNAEIDRIFLPAVAGRPA
ncbi:MAG: ABC transporter substrate-binding protein [Desulfuromonadaceae bacterium]